MELGDFCILFFIAYIPIVLYSWFIGSKKIKFDEKGRIIDKQ